MQWPPTLEDLKNDAKITVNTDDDALTVVLDAAIDFIQGVRRDLNYSGDLLDERPTPGDAFMLGVIRLARRWDTRRNSPDGLVSMGEMGSSRVSSGDVDIDRMLKIGRFRKPVTA